MATKLPLSELSPILEDAFRPCICTTETDERGGISYTVSDEDRPLWRVSLFRTEISEKDCRSTIRETRQRLKQSGVRLVPWRYPSVSAGAI